MVVPRLQNIQADRSRPLRVMIVDDSIVVRSLIARWVEAESDMEVVGALRSGLQAIEDIERLAPDIAVLDIQMPDLDGIAALPRLLKKKPDLIVIMASTLTTRNAQASLDALSQGAADYIPKPESTRDPQAAETFRRELIEKLRSLGARAKPKALATHSAPLQNQLAASISQKPISLRKPGLMIPKVLLIGSSTGGPKALMDVVAGIGPVIDKVPVLITQHMPRLFTAALAEQLARASGRPAHEGIDGEVVKAGRIYVAPGGRHMRVTAQGAGAVIALDDEPLINFCRPAVDPLFQSATAVWQGSILALILTGMGSDGMRGGRDLVAAGGSIIAQDEATSVVWGMPGAAAHDGICSAVLPLNQIAPRVVRVFSGFRT